jgi:hypothetical protein
MGSIISPPSPPPYVPPPAPAPAGPTEAQRAEQAAAEARERQRRGPSGTIATSWRGLLPAEGDTLPFRRKSLLGE